MIFTEDSPIVQSWVRLILQGKYKKEDVPVLGNLRDIVYSILERI